MYKDIKFIDILKEAESNNSSKKISSLIIRNLTLEPVFETCLNYYGRQFGYQFGVNYCDEYTLSNQNLNDFDLIFISIDIESDEYLLNVDYSLDKMRMTALFDKLKTCNCPIIAAFPDIDDNYINELFPSWSKVNVIPLKAIIHHIGERSFYDVRGKYLNNSRYTQEACLAIAKALVVKYDYINGGGTKCIVLDCDNVLWGGIASEEGINNIKLGQIGFGKAYQNFQNVLFKLYSKGFLLALCSKNDPETVWNIFDNHPDMILKREHIASSQINWENKADNIQKIALSLNIGLEHMVFIDDSDYEIELIRQALSKVKTIQLNPDKPHTYIDKIRDSGYCDYISDTSESKLRGQYYHEQLTRSEEKSKFTDIHTYHLSLNTVLTINRADNFTVPRLAELSQRTNQFNLTNKRYSHHELLDYINNKSYELLYVKAEDRFGEMGIVGMSLIEYCGITVYIRAFMLSCRVLCRYFENVFLENIINRADNHGCRQIIGVYVSTDKNKNYKNFYIDNHFPLCPEGFVASTNVKISYPDTFYKILGDINE